MAVGFTLENLSLIPLARARFPPDSYYGTVAIGMHPPLPVLFVSNEGQEPSLIHVQVAEDEAKLWLEAVQRAANYGFNARELNEIEQLVVEHRDQLLEAWNEHLG